jgi:hypothetical protein
LPMSPITRSTQLYPAQVEYFLLRWGFFTGSQGMSALDAIKKALSPAISFFVPG